MRTSLVSLLFSALFSTGAQAQAPAMAWEAFFDGSLPGLDEATALIVAADNSIYVTGGSANIAPQGTITTIRYAPDGSLIWADHAYGPSQDTRNEGIDLAIDPWGHVYVCGSISINSGDIGLIKYGPSGRIWKKNYEQYPTADVLDGAHAIAIDTSGHVFVAGFITSTSGMGRDSYMLQVDTAGLALWNYAFAVSSADEEATDVGFSPAGHLYTGGHWWNFTDGGVDMGTARMDSVGTVWNEGFVAPGYGDETAAIVATSANGVVTCGTVMGATSMDAAIVARDANGSELWHIIQAGSGNVDDDAVDVKELSDGRIAVVIHSRELVGGSLRHAITTMVIDSGAILWSDHYFGDASLGAWPTDMVVDANDNILISGYTIAAGGASTDGILLSYGASGDLDWYNEYDGGYGLDDRFHAITLNTVGDVIVCGTAYNGTGESRYVTVQYGNAVGVNDAIEGSSAPIVFPNPASSALNVAGLDARVEVEAFDVFGSRMAVPMMHGGIDVSQWNSGIYFLHFAMEQHRTILRFTVQH